MKILKWILVPTGAATTIYLSTKFLFRESIPKNECPLRKPDYQKDMIYMVQFPVSPFIRSISPFALKLETYLRLKKVSYEPVYTQRFKSKKGQIPYIEINGEQIPDSNQIIQELEKRGIAESDVDINPKDKAIQHLTKVAMENHTCITGFHWRYAFHMDEFYDKLLAPNFDNNWSMKIFRYLQPKGMKLRSNLHGIGRHSLDEVAEFSYEDLEALSALLGEKQFFNGDSPSTFDCTMFGHLVQFVYLPMDIPQKKFIREKCPNLLQFVERMKDLLWPDWNEMCEGKCMDGKKAVDLIH